MIKTNINDFDWYKTKTPTVKVRGSAALAAVYQKPAVKNLFSKTKYVWPTAMENDSRYMTRRVWGKEVPNV